jgi:hypothetical protein
MPSLQIIIHRTCNIDLPLDTPDLGLWPLDERVFQLDSIIAGVDLILSGQLETVFGIYDEYQDGRGIRLPSFFHNGDRARPLLLGSLETGPRRMRLASILGNVRCLDLCVRPITFTDLVTIVDSCPHLEYLKLSVVTLIPGSAPTHSPASSIIFFSERIAKIAPPRITHGERARKQRTTSSISKPGFTQDTTHHVEDPCYV